VKFIDKLSFILGVASIVILEFLALRHPTHFTQAQLSPSALTFISNQQIFASVSVGQLKVNEKNHLNDQRKGVGKGEEELISFIWHSFFYRQDIYECCSVLLPHHDWTSHKQVSNLPELRRQT
jgi:hypothetical protein